MSQTQTAEGRASDSGDIAFPPGRYGRRREARKRRPMVAAALTLAVALAGVGAAWMLYEQTGGEVTSRLLAYDDSVEGQVTITFEVYKDAGDGAVCMVRSRDIDGAEVGHAEVAIPADQSTRVETSYTLAVTGVPNTGEVLKCWTAD